MFSLDQVEAVVRHFLRFGASHADARDLAQETLLVAWQRRDDSKIVTEMGAWLFGIARNVYRNHTRSARRNPVQTTPETDLFTATSASNDDALASVLALQQALRALPETQQDVIFLHVLEGHTLQDTAASLNVPFETAKDRLRRARDTLRSSISTFEEPVLAAEKRVVSSVASGLAVGVLVGLLSSLATTPSASASTVNQRGASVPVHANTWASKLSLAAAFAVGAVSGVVATRALRAPTRVESTAPVRVEPRVVETAVQVPVVDAAGWDAGHARVAVTLPDASVPVRVSAPVVPRERVLVRATVRLDAGVTADVAAPEPVGLSAESLVLERARVALSRGRSDDALIALMSHARMYPSGQLAEERDVLLVQAYVAKGDARLARRRIAEYRAAHPTGVHREQVDALEARLSP